MNYEQIELDAETRRWLQSKDGLVTLTSAFRTGLYHLRVEGFFRDRMLQYKELKSHTYCIGLHILDRGSCIDNYWREPEPPEPLTQEQIEQMYNDMQEEERYIPLDDKERAVHDAELQRIIEENHPGMVFRFFFAFDFKSEAKDHFEALSNDAKNILLEEMWRCMSRFEPLKQDKKINLFNQKRLESGEIEDTNRICFIWEDTRSHRDSRLGGKWTDTTVTWANLIYESEVLESDPKIIRVAGDKFFNIRTIVQTYRPPIISEVRDGGSEIKSRLFMGSTTKLWEEKLTTYLLQRGFLVSLEPDLYIPEQSTEPRRTPDLMVIHKGRVIMIEIDSGYHLTKEVGDGRSKRTVANVERYERDRAFDRYMLCHGIPVLRVWFKEVEENPEQIMTQILQIYDSLGGDRFSYR